MSDDPIDNLDAILITGPTASGKSAYALDLADRHGGVVINADSMQVYDTLQVLTARPSLSDIRDIPHFLYGHVPAAARYSTGDWLRDMKSLIDRVRQQGQVPVIVGGTGLYFKALTGGLSDMPEIADDVRGPLRAMMAADGPEAMHALLRQRDPVMAQKLNAQDSQRILRALEVVTATGRSIADFQGTAGEMIIDPARAQKHIVLPERPVLYGRINRRFEVMLDQGAVEEVEALLRLDLSPAMPVMRAIGVSQIAAMLKGEMTRSEVIEKASTATRQYAKRQMTWFRNQMDDSWQRMG